MTKKDDEPRGGGDTFNVTSHGQIGGITAGIVNMTAPRPTSPQLQADIKATPVPVHFTGTSPFPYWAAVRIEAIQYEHNNCYLRVTTNAPIAERFVLERQNWPGGIVQMEANVIENNVFEHSETAPGIRPGMPWHVVLFSSQPIEIKEIFWEERSHFQEISQTLERIAKARAR